MEQLHWYGFCHYCGQSLADAHSNAEGLKCAHCGNITFMNSVAVAVLIAPCGIHESGRTHGVFIQKRGIAPNIGEWALVSGYVMKGETWEAAACREAAEEIQIVCRYKDVDDECPKHILTDNSSTRTQVIVVGYVEGVYHIAPFVPSTEVLERDVLFPDDTRQLCWPIHRKALALYWEKLGVPHNVKL